MVETLVSKNAEAVCNKDSGCEYMFAEKKYDELESLYLNFRRDPGSYAHILKKMTNYLSELGKVKF